MNTSANYRIIGIGGMPRSGKDTVADALIAHGYYGVSFGDILRDYARERHKEDKDPISIANMTETSNWLRSEHGADFFLKEALNRYEQARKQNDYKGVVLYSIRAPIEADFILEHGGQLVWVDASDDIRYERNVRAQRAGEPSLTKEEFLHQEALQWTPQPGIPKAVQMDLSYVKEKAQLIIPNEGSDIPAFMAYALKLLQIL